MRDLIIGFFADVVSTWTGGLQMLPDFPTPAILDELDPFDDVTLVPYDQMNILPEPDQTFELNVIMSDLSDGAN